MMDSIYAFTSYSGGVIQVIELYLNKLYLFLRDAKLLLRDSIYKLYINTVYLFLRDAKLLLRDPLIDKLYIYKVYLLLRDAKLIMRDAIYKYTQIQCTSF